MLDVCSAEELLQLLFYVHLRHHLVLLSFSSAVHHGAPHSPGRSEPGVLQYLPGGESLRGLPTQDGANQALGLGCERVGDVEVTPADFAEQRARLDIMEGVPPNEDGVKHDAQAPDVSCFTRIAAIGVEDLRTYVGWAAMFV